MKKINNSIKVIIINAILYTGLGAITYLLIPSLLNYPPNSIDNEFQKRVVGISYSDQFLLLGVLVLIINSIFLRLLFRKIDNWEKVKKDKEKVNIDEILKIRNICLNGMYRIMPLQVLLTGFVIFILLTIASTELGLTLKLVGIICIWCIISNLILNVFTSRIYNRILKETYFVVQNYEKDIKQISIKSKILFQTVSVILVIVYILSLYSYSRINVERSSFLKEKELIDLNQRILQYGDDIFDYINSSKDNYFILNKNFEQVYGDTELTKFAVEYIKEYPTTNNTYYQYGSSLEGVYNLVKVDNEIYYIGKLYDVMTINYTSSILLFDAVFLIMYILIIGFFAEEIRGKLATTATRLKEIGDAEHEIGKELEVTSNDEFRNLIQAYNQVQKNTDRFIKDLKDKQEVIVKQGQLVSIGELAGGVAHDINTPISAIKTGLQLLQEMYTPRDETEKELLMRMGNCTEKIIKIVNSMRNQIRNLGSDQKYNFKVSEVINDVKIIAYNEIQKGNCDLVINIEDDLSVYGDPTKLGQVFTNLLVNAIQAYNGNGGKIEISVTKAPGNRVMIKVRDYAGGIPEKIKEYVFKNILTTKGTKGTGLGLYLAYSVIKGEFSGEITFESTEGEGTTFYIVLDRANENNKEVQTITQVKEQDNTKV